MWQIAEGTALTAEVLAWTLIHFVWQGAALGACGVLLLQLCRTARPQTRYVAGLTVFALMAAAPLATWSYLTTQQPVALPRSELLAAVESQPEPSAAIDDLATILATEVIDTNWQWDDVVPALVPAVTGTETPVVDAANGFAFWPQLVVASWLAGMVLTSLRLFGAVAWMGYVIGRLQPVDPATLQQAQRIARRLGLRRLPRISLSADVTEPLALQWFRPCVLLPASWLSDVPPGLLEAVLAHELAHIRRHDLWVNLLQRLVETLLFFHPCVWWVSRQIRIERELCCDADAVRATGQPVVYAQALEVVAQRRWARASVSLAVGMGGSRMALLNRVKRVLGVETSAAGSDWWTLGVASVGVSAACWLGASLWTAPVQGQEAADALALANAEGDREGPPPPRRGEREDGPPRGERREGEPRPEGREGPPPPRGPEGERGPRGPGPDGDRGPRGPEGDRGPRGPEAERGPRGPEGEGRPPHRPPHEIAWELTDLIRESAERGQPVPKEQIERLVRELQQAHPRHAGPGRGPMMTRERVEGDRPGPGPGPGMAHIRIQGGPPMEHMQDMMHAVRELRHEVERLRAELHEMRGHRPPGPPREGEREGPPRGPREEDGRRPEGRPEGPRPEGARDGDGPRPDRRPEQ